jgi:hypothetical protein
LTNESQIISYLVFCIVCILFPSRFAVAICFGSSLKRKQISLNESKVRENNKINNRTTQNRNAQELRYALFCVKPGSEHDFRVILITLTFSFFGLFGISERI